MNTGAWNTKNDLLEDLGMVAGSANVDDNYIVRGCGPPPLLREQEDEEERLLQFGMTGGGDGYGRPDLEGIQAMIKMVSNFDDSDGNGGRGAGDWVDSDIVITKLNPNIPEFVPKSIPKKEQTDIVDTEAPVVVNKTPIVDTETPIVNNNNNIDDSDQIEKKTTQLREKIQNATKIKNKQDKNVAVVSLLKLLATKNEQNKPPVLLPPDFFKNPVTTESIPKAESAPSPVADVKASTPNTNDSVKVELETDIPNAEAEIIKSVEKVNDWLNPKPVIKSPKLHLEPMTFRKKNVSRTSSPMSSSPMSSSSSVQVKSATDEFVPSERARKLTEMYTKRVAEREAAAEQKNQIVTLDNLEEKLRARDEIVKNKNR